MKLALAIVLAALSLTAAQSSFAETCNSRDGLKVLVDGSKVVNVSGNIQVTGKTTGESATVFKGYDSVLFSLHCEYGTSISFEQSSSILIVICADHTSTEQFSAALNCQ